MERKSFFRLALHLLWGFLIVVILLLFFRERLGDIPGLVRRLRRDPQALVSVFKPRDMAGFGFSPADPDHQAAWRTSGTRLEAVDGLWGEDETWWRVTYRPTGSPGLLLLDETMGVMDWRGAESLSFTVYNPQTWQVHLKVKVKDTAGNDFQRGIDLPPLTRTAVAIPTRDLADRLDLGRVGYLNLFLWRPSSVTDLYLVDLGFPAPGRPLAPAGPVKFMGLRFPSTVRPGERVEAAFYFIAQRELGDDHTLLIRLRRGEEIFLLSQTDPPTPTSRWRPGRLAKVGPFEVGVPPGLDPGRYGLEVILARSVPSPRGVELIFQTFDNPEIDGHRVAEIIVTDSPEM